MGRSSPRPHQSTVAFLKPSSSMSEEDLVGGNNVGKTQGEKVMDSNEEFMWACKNGHLHIVNRLLETPEEGGVRVDEKDMEGNTGFMWACKNGHLKIVNRLLELPEERGVR